MSGFQPVTDYPLLRFRQERPAIVQETTERALQAVLSASAPEYVINDACLQEIRRLSESSAQEEVRGLSDWKRLWRSIGGKSRRELEHDLHGLIGDYCEDVAGGFNQQVYTFATRVVPPALSLLLTPESPLRLPLHMLQPQKLLELLAERLIVQGPLDHLRTLAQKGTLVCVPTHLSNLDSPVMGYALQASGLPPTTYGAGKNLFTNPVLGFFMRNCGAYRVDRRIRHELYKDVLKTYSQVILERGYHSMFFPGGTRSRSGRVEGRIKLGLLGTSLTATIEGFRRQAGLSRGPAVKPIYIVPVTINQQLVLEAETLIADYLKETGKARFIIEDDESAQWRKVVDFVRSTMTHTGAIVIRFGAPMDVLGHRVTEAGESLGPHGQPVELARYFWVHGKPQALAQRDGEYMQQTGAAIGRAYRRETVLLPTHLLASVLWRRVCQALPGIDLYRRLRQPLDLHVPHAELLSDMERLQNLLRHKRHHLGPRADGTPEQVVEAALAAFGSYHTEPAALRTPSQAVTVGDRQLLYYYQNRIESLGDEQ
ncbi:MAG: 1-acyl-sn-glycerol-3-phosphate acyltransferase [Myxococcales bacterium]|nr:1-acyl-sn-glycerol-3-phosphate acyltransferase [Myxococcales bacterium]